MNCIHFNDLTDDAINREKLLKDLNLNPDIELTEKVKGFIFANISNNIGLLIDIVNGFNSGQLDHDFNMCDINNLTKELLVNKDEYEKMSKASNPYGDGKASKRITDAIINRYKK